MRSHWLVPTLAGALLIPLAGARAQDTGSAATVNEPSSSEEVVCRRYPAPPGSRIGARRVCKTEAEWAEIGQEVRDTMEDIGNRNRMGAETGDVGFPGAANPAFNGPN